MSKNVFEDLGFSTDQAEELGLRTTLVSAILKIVEKHQYTQKELQLILDQPQPEISYLLRGKIQRFSAEKLIKFLNRLEAKVEVTVKIPRRKIAI